MTEDQADLLRKADESLRAAQVLLKEGFHGYAASRAYYAMFYVVEALLEGEALSFSKHSAVIAAFGRFFVRSGKAPAIFHQHLMRAQELRHAGDYAAIDAVSFDQAKEQVARGSEFIDLARRLIGPIPGPDPSTP
jgi:uncharacterized protein (UPF0332 family)